MSNIGGKKKEASQQVDFSKKVGLFSGKVIAVNPSIQEYKEVLGIELKEDSKAIEYLNLSKEGNTTLRVDFWLEEVKNKEKFKVTFFLENKKKVNKDGTKNQYINTVGICSWAGNPSALPTWVSNRECREAYVGEEELYTFLRTWLGNLDFKDGDTTLSLDWKALMRGNVNDLRSQIDGEFSTNVVVLATVKTVEKDGEIKEYQNIFNKAFLPEYCLKQFRVMDYNKIDVQSSLRLKKSKDLKPYERFVVNVTGEYGCRDFYTFSDLQNYSSDSNFAASSDVVSSDGPDY